MFNSFIFDYMARHEASPGNRSYYVVKQLPVIVLEQVTAKLATFVFDRFLELTYTAWDLEPFAQDCGYAGPPFRWDEERFLLRAQLDSAFFNLYGIERDDVSYILETFPIVKRKDLARPKVNDSQGNATQPGSYITKDKILAIYDEMQIARTRGRHTRLAARHLQARRPIPQAISNPRRRGTIRTGQPVFTYLVDARS